MKQSYQLHQVKWGYFIFILLYFWYNLQLKTTYCTETFMPLYENEIYKKS